MKEVKKKRGRPREKGSKKKGIFIRADDALCKELRELSALEGMTQADYIRDAIKMRANLTRVTKENTSNFMDEEHWDESFEDEYDEF